MCGVCTTGRGRAGGEWGRRNIPVEKGIDSTQKLRVSDNEKLQRSMRRIHESQGLNRRREPLAAWIEKRKKDGTYPNEESKSPGPIDVKVVSHKYERTKQERETYQGSDPPVSASVITDNQPINNESREPRRNRRDKRSVQVRLRPRRQDCQSSA